MNPLERGPRQRPRESYYQAAERDVRWMLGDISDEEWEDVQEAFVDLRIEMGRMQWFSVGPNTVSARQSGEQWVELTFAPGDAEQEQRLKDLLGRLRIVPWEEVQGNVPVLIVENRRDVALLRGGLIFDYLADARDRQEREQFLEEARIRYAGQMEEVMRHIREMDEREAEEKKERERERVSQEAKRQEEREWNLRIDTEGAEFRRLREEERERRIAALLASIPRAPAEQFEPPARPPQDQRYRFGYPPTARYSTVGRQSPLESAGRPQSLEAGEIDEELEAMLRDFEAGALNEETIEADIERAAVRGHAAPDLKLFPRKYRWKVAEGARKGHLETVRTQEEVTDQDIENIVLLAQTAPQETRDMAFRELALMHRSLILWTIREVKRRNPNADPDELLQAGLQGMVRAADKYEPRPDGNFRRYLMPYMEGYMRSAAANSHVSTMYVPENVSGSRKRVFDAHDKLRSQAPDSAVAPRTMAKLLALQKVTKDESSLAYDRYLRKTLFTYEETGLDPLDDETFAAHDADMKGEPLQASMAGDGSMRELEENVSAVLLTLTPREERVLRTYYEINMRPGQLGDKAYARAAEKLGNGMEHLPSEYIQEKIRELTAHGDLTDPEVQASLPENDRAVLAAYLEALDEMQGPATYESVGRELGVTRERVRQIEAKALRKLKHPSRSRHLRPFRERE